MIKSKKLTISVWYQIVFLKLFLKYLNFEFIASEISLKIAKDKQVINFKNNQ